MPKSRKAIGSSLDEFLKEEGIYEECDLTAIKRVLSYQLLLAMEKNQLTKSAMAQEMGTSRSALDRLLDPENESVTLETLRKAADATGQRLVVRFVEN